jgi:hypothetical protein
MNILLFLVRWSRSPRAAKQAGDDEQEGGFKFHIRLSINKTNEGRCKTNSPRRIS